MYDVCIIGAGISGMFLAYTLTQNSNLKILMIEKGKVFSQRICPIENKQTLLCVNCNICSRLQGFGGLGRSEGKFNYTNDFGGNLGKVVGYNEALKLMDKVDEILCSFGGEKKELYSTKNQFLENLIKEENFKILATKTRHLGRTLSYEFIEKMYLYLKHKIDILCETEVNFINKENEVFNLNTKDNVFYSKKVVLAMGSTGYENLKSYCENFHILPSKTRVDMGIRVEMKKEQLKSILKYTKEIKLQYKDENFEAFTYCMNPGGKVIKKYQDNMVMADGQNQFETKLQSSNLNFTIFVPMYFSSKEEATKYIKEKLTLINKNKDRVVIQRLEDLLKNRKTTKKQLTNNSIHPTLDAYCCNLYDEIPEIYIKGALKIFKSMEDMIGEKIHQDTLLYGVDVKFYEPEINLNKYFESKEKNLYLIGDSSGITHSLSQAAASGIYLGNYLKKYNYKK